MNSFADFEEAYPRLHYHVAKGKLTAGEPLYGAIIITVTGVEIGHGESDVSAEDAFGIAARAAGLTWQPPQLFGPHLTNALADVIAADRDNNAVTLHFGEVKSAKALYRAIIPSNRSARERAANTPKGCAE